MYIEVHYETRTGAILAVWEAGSQPYDNPRDGWKPFQAPADPATGEALVKQDGTLDPERLPEHYGAAKIDLDYETQLLIERGAYDLRMPKAAWIQSHLEVDLASVRCAPREAGYMTCARLKHIEAT